MPPAAESPAASRPAARPRITDTFAQVEALSLCHTAHAGGRVALRFATGRGILVVTLPLASWLAAHHAPADHNGNPWPAAPDARAQTQAQLEADAAALRAKGDRAAPDAPPPSPFAPQPPAYHRRRNGSQTAKYAAMRAEFLAAPLQPIAALCARHGVLPQSFSNWMSTYHRGEVRAARAAAAKALPESPELARMRGAWRRFIADPRLTIRAQADEMGLNKVTLAAAYRRFRREPGAPVLKPHGKL